MCNIVFSSTAEKQLKKANTECLVKIHKLLASMLEDPFDGIGKPERLQSMNAWSRRIDKKNRLIYVVKGETIEIVSILGHYEDH